MKKNIVLVGMMGSGKTSVGRTLSEILVDFSFIDMDSVIEEEEMLTISEIFAQKGEEYFRQKETDVIKNYITASQVVSTGGGVFQKDENISLLKQNGIIFYLKSGAQELYNRLENDDTRPLLMSTELKGKIVDLLAEREYNYQKAHEVIDTANKSVVEIANLIIEKYKNYDRT